MQVRKEWKRRIGAEYVEAIPDCELIPNHTYKLIGEPVTVIQPEVCHLDAAPALTCCFAFSLFTIAIVNPRIGSPLAVQKQEGEFVDAASRSEP